MNEKTVVEALSMGKDEIAYWLAGRVAEMIGAALDEVDVTAPFANFGISSMAGVTLSGEIADALGMDVPPTLLWDYPTIERLASYLEGLWLAQQRAA
jgi:acyl carrier protein